VLRPAAQRNGEYRSGPRRATRRIRCDASSGNFLSFLLKNNEKIALRSAGAGVSSDAVPTVCVALTASPALAYLLSGS
jgi:hypothetical protein